MTRKSAIIIIASIIASIIVSVLVLFAIRQFQFKRAKPATVLSSHVVPDDFIIGGQNVEKFFDQKKSTAFAQFVTRKSLSDLKENYRTLFQKLGWAFEDKGLINSQYHWLGQGQGLRAEVIVFFHPRYPGLNIVGIALYEAK